MHTSIHTSIHPSIHIYIHVYKHTYIHTQLEHVDLTDNVLSRMPTWVGTYSKAQAILLGGNQLSTVPNTIGSMGDVVLVTINLSNNGEYTYTCIYMCVCVCVCMYICIYIYIYIMHVFIHAYWRQPTQCYRRHLSCWGGINSVLFQIR